MQVVLRVIVFSLPLSILVVPKLLLTGKKIGFEEGSVLAPILLMFV